MNKIEFMRKLQIELSKSVTRQESDKAMLYYGELIDDAMDSGRTEAEVIAKLPRPEEIAYNLSDIICCDRQEHDIPDRFVPPILDKIFEEEKPQTFKNKMGEQFRAVREDVREQGKFVGDRMREEGKAFRSEAKSGNGFVAVGKFFLFCLLLFLVFPVTFGLLMGVWGTLIGFFATAVSLLITGICLPFAAVVAAVQSSSFVVFFSMTAAGMLLISLGCIFLKLTSLLLNASFYVTKKILRGAAALLK